jgi:methionyl aminopeptidase
MEKTQITKYKQAGRIAKDVREFTAHYVKSGMKLLDIAEAIDEKIKSLGAEPAFPVNLSLNEIAAHYTPRPGDQTIAQGILKIDIGTCVDGYIGDTAITLDLTENKQYSKMIEANKKLLNAAKKIINSNLEVGNIGNTISEKLEKYNTTNKTKFNIIPGLTGHALEKNTIHAKPNIPNYKNSNPKKLNGTAFAIEPFITTGTGEIYEGEGGGIYMLKNENGQVRDRDARAILQHITTTYKTRPFCARWLEKTNLKKTNFALSILTKQGIIHHFPLLIEKTKSPVSQMEHSFLIHGEEAICLTD